MGFEVDLDKTACDKITMTNKHKSNLSSNSTQVFLKKNIYIYIYIYLKKEKRTQA